MASPILKTEETMNLAQALLEDHSSTNFDCSDDGADTEDNLNDRLLDNDPTFRALVVTKDSSTELIPTELVESSGGGKGTKTLSFVKDMNAGKGMYDDDGKPAVGKVFSRVIRTSNNDKPKNSKSRRSSRKDDAATTTSKCKDARPQSSTVGKRRNCNSNGNDLCPSCGRQFSEEALKRHMSFCSN